MSESSSRENIKLSLENDPGQNENKNLIVPAETENNSRAGSSENLVLAIKERSESDQLLIRWNFRSKSDRKIRKLKVMDKSRFTPNFVKNKLSEELG